MTQDVWTVKAILDWCETYLKQHGDAQPRLSAQWLLSEVLGLSRVELYTNFDKPLTSEERALMRSWVTRRAQGEPLQLISGKAPFRHLTLSVEPGVLIPRPETEVLVSEALKELDLPSSTAHVVWEKVEDVDEDVFKEAVQQAQAPELQVLDLCTGSGCIAASIASECPSARVIASDISLEACSLAQKNAHDLGLTSRITVVQNNLMQGMAEHYASAFDLIISNPPYIPSETLKTLSSEVTSFEPTLALDGGKDGLEVVRCFLSDAYECLKPGGVLALELFEESLMDAAQLLSRHEFSRIRIAQDLTGRNRVLVAHKPSAGVNANASSFAASGDITHINNENAPIKEQ